MVFFNLLYVIMGKQKSLYTIPSRCLYAGVKFRSHSTFMLKKSVLSHFQLFLEDRFKLFLLLQFQHTLDVTGFCRSKECVTKFFVYESFLLSPDILFCYINSKWQFLKYRSIWVLIIEITFIYWTTERQRKN